MVMETIYHPQLVLLSILVAILASYVALDLSASVTQAIGKAKAVWLVGGALAMGFGIWSMHFIGMLAFEMPGMSMAYDVPLLILSVLIAFAASVVALYVTSRPKVRNASFAIGGVAMAAAISGMHYTGMYSMRMAARIEWNTTLVLLSILIALVASFAALWIAIQLRGDRKSIWPQFFASILMGFAISGMHYTGMEAATFVHIDALPFDNSNILVTEGLGVAVIGTTLLIMAVALAGSVMDRALARRTRKAEESVLLYQEAEAANITKTRFLANMSHEIRTPLGAILGFTELLMEENLPQQERKEYLGIIYRSARSLSQLIDDVLDLSKVEMGRLEVEKTSFVLKNVINDVIALLRIKAQEKSLSLRLFTESSVPETLISDSNRIRQILVNIIGNAIKFTEKGEVRVTQKILHQNNQQFLAFEVTDTGIGLSENQQSKLFKAFSQADSSTTRRYGGTGLGLEISRRLARALGGDLVLKNSAPQHGSTFLLTIPLGPSEQIAVQVQSEQPEMGSKYQLSGMKILIVEDMPDNQILVSRLLEKRGAQVQFADHGSEAIEKAQSLEFDAILMDIQMPVMDGYEATRRLRANGFTKPIIALTAYAMKEDRETCLKVGCTGYLTKPVQVGALVSKLLELSNRA